MTQVEVLYESEVESQHPECNSESLKILEELGLTLQIEKYSKKENVVEVTFPFIPATNEQLFVYKSNFPVTTELKGFSDEVIPLRVLEIIKKAKDTNKFEKILIWHKDNSVIREDPIAVGVIKVSSYNHVFYLLARWGDSLVPYSVLRQKAIEKFKITAMDNLTSIARSVATNMKLIEKGEIPRISSSWREDVEIPSISFNGYTFN